MKTTSTLYESGTKIDLSDTALEVQVDALTKLKATLKLEVRMLAYDALHGTKYRTMRHAIVARDRNAAFEKSIGIVRSTDKK